MMHKYHGENELTCLPSTIPNGHSSEFCQLMTFRFTFSILRSNLLM